MTTPAEQAIEHARNMMRGAAAILDSTIGDVSPPWSWGVAEARGHAEAGAKLISGSMYGESEHAYKPRPDITLGVPTLEAEGHYTATPVLAGDQQIGHLRTWDSGRVEFHRDHGIPGANRVDQTQTALTLIDPMADEMLRRP